MELRPSGFYGVEFRDARDGETGLVEADVFFRGGVELVRLAEEEEFSFGGWHGWWLG